MRLVALAPALALAGAALAQSSTPTATTSLSLTTLVTTVPVPLPTNAATHTTTSFETTTITTSVPVTFKPTATAPGTSASPSATNGTSSSTTLDTHLDPAFGVLGAILIFTGIPSAFWGHKNRWSSFFIIGFYTLALVTVSLILKFGVLDAVNPPSKTLRGLFVLSCGVAGIAGGAVAIFFWKGAKYFIGGWGGFTVGLWIQCFRAGGLIRPIGFRWLFFIACGTVGFVSCTVPKWHWHVMLLATSFVGATAFILGVDCFASTGLKEFYIFNLGFNDLFPKFNGTGVDFPLTQVMEILLGLIAAVFLMGASVQLRILVVLRKKLKEINDEEARRVGESEALAAERFEAVNKDLERWEKEHGRQPSNLSGVPLLSDATTPDGRYSSQFSLPYNGRPRHSMISGDPTAVGESPDPSKSQNPGVLPKLDLGDGIEATIPENFVSSDPHSVANDAELQEKNELLAEIASIRRSIDVLRTGNASPRQSIMFPDEARTRLQSFSQSLNGLEMSDRPRTHSMDLYKGTSTSMSRHVRTQSTPLSPAAVVNTVPDNRVETARTIGRSSSTPLREDWDAYTQERTLFTPPAGVTPPIAPVASPVPRRASLFAIPTAVSEALMRRQKRESVFLETGAVEPEIEMGGMTGRREAQNGSHSSDNVSAPRPQHRKTGSFGTMPRQLMSASPAPVTQTPVTILPPQRKNATTPENAPKVAPQTHTFEELTARHREKLRTLQDPLSKAEKEQADLDKARERWSRSKAIERDVMARKEVEARERLKGKEKERGRPKKGAASPEREPERSRSADKLAGSGRRMSSAMKVQEWQRYQQEVEPPRAAAAQHTGTSASRRESRAPPADVPFPGRAPGTDKRRSRTADLFLNSATRDPPS